MNAETKQLPTLAPHERELVSLAAQGESCAQMAWRLGVPLSTIRSRLVYARRRFNALSTAQLVAIAIRTGQIE
jgi:DNA-binding CsgD family transcriptional regulator